MSMTAVRGGRRGSLSVGSVSERARTMARNLLQGYYHQDERESYLLQGKPEQAREAASLALDRMATVFEMEFEHRPSSRARRAGTEFMTALFVQDEIENWELFLRAPERTHLQEILYSDLSEMYGPSVGRDERWDLVREHLETTCELVEIDPTYAGKQSQFWLLHGQLNEYWEEIAMDAHSLKLEAMVPEPDPAIDSLLGEYFVEGVKRHNRWSHRELSEDVTALQDIVEPYYQKILDLRSPDRS